MNFHFETFFQLDSTLQFDSDKRKLFSDRLVNELSCRSIERMGEEKKKSINEHESISIYLDCCVHHHGTKIASIDDF